jgi:hypothetical protein
MGEPGDRYQNDMIYRAMEDDRRSSGYNPADHEPGNQGLEEDQAPDQRRSKMSGQTEDQAQGQMRNHVRDQVHSHAQVQTSRYSEGQGTQAKSSPAEGKGKGNGKSRGIFLKGLISGTVISDSIILKDIRYSILIVLLAIIFIANRFNAERMEREITVLEQEVRDLRAEALSVSADLGSVSRQSEITDLVKERGLGLEELREPPYRIVVNE